LTIRQYHNLLILSYLCGCYIIPQRKEPKKAAPIRRPSLRCGFPALLAKPGCCGTRALRSNSPRRNPPAWLRYSAADQGDRKTIQNRPPPPGRTPKTRATPTKPKSPSAPPRFSEKIGGRRRGLSERKARVPQPPDLFEKPREAQRAGAAGCPFVWLLIFWASKIKLPAAGQPPASKHLRVAHTKSITACNNQNKKL